MAIPSAFFSGTEDKDDVHVYEESDDDVLLIEEQTLVLCHCIDFPRSRSDKFSLSICVHCWVRCSIYLELTKRIFSAKFLP